MLVVDPLKRITIPEIRQHPWFIVNLPDYLANPPVVDAEPQIDEEILGKIVDMGFSKGEIERCIRDREQTQETVAYYLVLDNSKRHKKAQQELQKQMGGTPPTGGNSPLRDHPMGIMMAGEGSGGSMQPGGSSSMQSGAGFIGSKSPQGASYTGAYGATGIGLGAGGDMGSLGGSMALQGGGGGMMGGMMMMENPLRWRLGVGSRHRGSAKETLDEVYSLLRAMEAKWLRKSPYCLECKRVVQQGGREVSCVFGLRLYKEPVEPAGHRMVLDMRRVTGDALVFFDICAWFHRAMELPQNAPGGGLGGQVEKSSSI